MITGLKAKEDRNDFQGRRVRNSFFWVCDASKIQNAEAKVRSLLVRALHGELEQDIDSYIDSGGEYGFKVKGNDLEKLLNSPLSIENTDNTDLGCKIGSNTKSSRQKLAEELRNNSLPERKGILVLITSIKSASALKEVAVWRGLSNRIKDKELEEVSSLETVNRQAQKKTIFLGIAIALISIVAIALLIIKFTTLQKPQPEIIPTPSTIQENSSSTSTEELNPSVDLTKAKGINYSNFSYISNEEYGI